MFDLNEPQWELKLIVVATQWHRSSRLTHSTESVSQNVKLFLLVGVNLFILINLRSVLFVWQEISLQRRSARVQLLQFCSFYDWHIVVAVILRDEAHGRPVVLMVVWVVGDKLLRVSLVQSVNLNGALQGVAQQEHLHLHERQKKK